MLALAFTLPVHGQAEAPFDMAQLMRTLAQVKAGEATFTEKRSVAMLERTLESSGRLSFEAPDSFTRETLKPRRDRVSVVGNTVTMSQGSRSRTVALDAVPEAAVIMEAIRGTLTGNRAALEKNFSTSVSGNAQRWALELVPRDWRLREQVTSVRVSGQQALLREVVVAMADGDRSVMTIEPAVAGPRSIEPAAAGPRSIEPAAAGSGSAAPAAASAAPRG
ncbi:MAG: outer membrane lipoprotein carrier protein LolA [Bacteriovorax sp.]|nr:outer membrane lipoprotein carrier protein LolA [Rhizobacter sp.]